MKHNSSEQPEKDSQNNNGEQPNTDSQTDVTKSGEQPSKEDSSKQPRELPDRFAKMRERRMAEEKGDDAGEKSSEEKKEDKKETIADDTNKPEDSKEEKPKDEEADDEEYSIDGDKLIVSKGEEKQELVKVDLGDGKYGFVPEDKKDGYLRQSDYTKKTQKIAEKEKELYQLQYIDILGSEVKKPSIKDFSFDKNKFMAERETLMNNADNLPDDFEFDDDKALENAEKEAMEKYEKALKGYEQYMTDKMKLDATVKDVEEQSVKNIAAFGEKHGEEVTAKVMETVKMLTNPLIYKKLVPITPEGLELIRKGLAYDNDVKLKSTASKIEKVKELNEKSRTKPVTRTSKHTPSTTPEDERRPERYRFNR